MNRHQKETVIAWAIVLGAMLVGVAIGYFIGNDPSLDELEARMERISHQAQVVNQECIAELEARDRVLQREVNIFHSNSTSPTNGI